MILIGTSGYSFPDWKGTFYPEKLPGRSRLTYYAEHFPTLEVNTSFYHLPSERLFKGMQQRVPRDFLFWVKLYRGLTHEKQPNLQDLKQLLKALIPLQEAGQLAGLLAQFPWSFQNQDSSWERIQLLAEAVQPFSLAVEFRHRSWDQPETYERLHSAGLTFCVTDEPQIADLMPPTVQCTTPTAYFRLHGRNPKTWWGKDPHLRYDYLYSTQELSEWADKIKTVEPKVRRVFIFFNNCHAGQEAKNAQMLREMLGQPLPSGRLF